MKRLMMLVLAVSMVGCSGSVSGTVGGVSMSVADAIFGVVKDDAGKSVAAYVIMADVPKICDSLKANRNPKNATALSLSVFRFNDNQFLAPDVGEYTVNPNPTTAGNYVLGTFTHGDSNCTNTISDTASGAKSGLVKITNFKGESNGNAAGTFDITFGAGDKVTGSFNASYCDLSKLGINPSCE